MYHGKVTLTLVLTVKRNYPMTLSKHVATCGKENKETGNDHALLVSRMLRNCLEGSREFYNLAIDIKAGRVRERGVSRCFWLWAVFKIKDRFEAKWSPASAGPPAGRRWRHKQALHTTRLSSLVQAMSRHWCRIHVINRVNPRPPAMWTRWPILLKRKITEIPKNWKFLSIFSSENFDFLQQLKELWQL